VTDIDEFIELVADQLGLAITPGDAGLDLHELPGWDSVYLLRLLVVIERRAGRQLSLPDLLDAPNLESIYRLAVAG